MNGNTTIFEASYSETIVEETIDEISTLSEESIVDYFPHEYDNLSIEVKILIGKYLIKAKESQKLITEQNVKVSEVFGPLAFLYEKLRNAVDYKGEHVLRRNAIERILKRFIWERPKGDSGTFATLLAKELIWARYIKNDTIPERKLNEVSIVIAKHLKLFQILEKYPQEKLGSNLSSVKSWFLGVASAELEEIIDPEVFYLDAINASVFSWFKKYFDWQDQDLTESDKDVQLLIAINRSLSKSDTARVRFHLLKAYHSDFTKLQKEDIENNIDKLLVTKKDIELQLNSKFQARIYRYVQRQSAAFHILKEIIENDVSKSADVLKNDTKLKESVLEVITEKYSEITKRVSRGITRSVIYIFTTKVLLALLIEVPYELLFIGSINYLALGINTVFPPFLMFLVGMSIKTPGEDNTKRIIQKINSFVYVQKEIKKTNFSLFTGKRSKISYRIFSLIYIILSFVILTAITFVLLQLKFNIISGIIFFMFLSLVLLFGYRVKFTASELNVTKKKESILSHLFTNITLPFLSIGTVLSEGFAKLNIFTVFMDFLFEVPFKRIMGIFEEWTSFIRERKDEVVEVPA